MLDPATLIARWGYPALFAGALLEGETILVMAGFLAHRGYLSLPVVMATAAIGGFLGDQVYFWAGRFAGPRIAARFPALAPRIAQADGLISAHPVLASIGIRFLYGLRTAGPIAIGMSRVPAVLFALANGAGAVVWAIGFALMGYLVGDAAERMLGRVKSHEPWLLAGIAAIGLVAWLTLRKRRRAVGAHSEPPRIS